MMLIRLLGVVELVADSGEAVGVGPPQRCTVLAALAVDAGRSVPVEVLLERVWGLAIPAKARRALQAHLVYLRQGLRSSANGMFGVDVVRRLGGYMLTADRGHVALHRFRGLAGHGTLP